MITLYQHPVSPFCIAIEAILRHAKADYKIVNLPLASDRRIVVEKSQGQSYKIPLIEDDDLVVWDNADLGQEIARYLDAKFNLGLFPPELEGLQAVLARYIEGAVEAVSFKRNDIHCEEWLPDLYDRTMFIRHKERKFGAGCLAQWREQEGTLKQQLEELLAPLDQMLSQKPLLLDDRPCFVDFDLFGILGNYLFTGRHGIPARFPRLRRWHGDLTRLLG